MTAKGGYVYIVSNKRRTVLYVGVTSNLYARIYEHKNGVGSEFTKKYNCVDVLFYEFYPSIEEAIHREKRLKKWNRAWKDELIKKFNPELRDLFEKIEDMQ
ncbi:MAG: GIY-YIG nuclease family protein [Cyclobacteriaceae bacterium]